MRFLIILVGVVCLALPACAPPQQAEPVAEEAPSTEADVEAILNLAKEECAAAELDDPERSLAILSADIEQIPPNQPAIRGDQVRQSIREEQSTAKLKYSNQEVIVDGDLAYHRYSFEVTSTPKDGGDSTFNQGAGIQILQRQQDGSWKITKDIWNRDAPPADQN